MKVLNFMSGFPAWGSNQRTGNPQGIWTWRPGGFNYRTSTGLGKTDFTLRGHKQSLVCTKTQGKGAVTPQETGPKLPAGVEESPVEAWVGRGSPQDVGDWQQQSGKGPLPPLVYALEVVINPTIEPLHPRGCQLRAQTTRERVQPHPSADNWIKVLLSKALPTRARPSSSQNQSLPSGLLAFFIRGQTEAWKTTVPQD